jgi:hypothetical protein
LASARSGFERALMQKLDSEGVEWSYETVTYPIQLDSGLKCQKCGERVIRNSRFTPDFFFPKWTIEAKGKFTARDRKRVLALLGSPCTRTRNFGMLFMRDNKISKSSKTRYSDWCEKNRIPYAFGWFKKEWLR